MPFKGFMGTVERGYQKTRSILRCAGTLLRLNTEKRYSTVGHIHQKDAYVVDKNERPRPLYAEDQNIGAVVAKCMQKDNPEAATDFIVRFEIGHNLFQVTSKAVYDALVPGQYVSLEHQARLMEHWGYEPGATKEKHMLYAIEDGRQVVLSITPKGEGRTEPEIKRDLILKRTR